MGLRLHPLVRRLLAPELWDLAVPDDPVAAEREVSRRRGMVRASLAMYSTRDDVEALVAALHDLTADVDRYRAAYPIDDQGNYTHAAFTPSGGFDLAATVDQLLDARPDAGASPGDRQRHAPADAAPISGSR